MQTRIMRSIRGSAVAILAIALAAPIATLPSSGAPASTTVTSDTTATAASRSIIANGQVLRNGATRVSGNGLFVLSLQHNGNLVLYRRIGGGIRAIWASDTGGFGAVKLVLQRDGNLVMFKGSRPIWATNSSGAGSRAFLAVQNDGNLVVYYRPGSAAWVWGRTFERHFIWPGHLMRSRVVLQSRNKAYRVAMQGDGNFVLFRVRDRRVLWHTGTAGRPGAYGRQLRDGNFALFARNGRAYWSTRTSGHPGSFLAIADNGNLMIWKPRVGALWQTRTGQ